MGACRSQQEPTVTQTQPVPVVYAQPIMSYPKTVVQHSQNGVLYQGVPNQPLGDYRSMIRQPMVVNQQYYPQNDLQAQQYQPSYVQAHPSYIQAHPSYVQAQPSYVQAQPSYVQTHPNFVPQQENHYQPQEYTYEQNHYVQHGQEYQNQE